MRLQITFNIYLLHLSLQGIPTRISRLCCDMAFWFNARKIRNQTQHQNRYRVINKHDKGTHKPYFIVVPHVFNI